jgi:HEAT repeat protein
MGVSWALAQIGDKRAIRPLISSLSDEDPSFRVQVIRALQELQATDAIPALTLLLNDHDHSHVDDLIPVAEAARQAIAHIESGSP